MNDLIDTVFGDPFITLNCDSGECLPLSLVPGYEVIRSSHRLGMSWADLPNLALSSCRSLPSQITANGSP